MDPSFAWLCNLILWDKRNSVRPLHSTGSTTRKVWERVLDVKGIEDLSIGGWKFEIKRTRGRAARKMLGLLHHGFFV
jgi:hypothetical protein